MQAVIMASIKYYLDYSLINMLKYEVSFSYLKVVPPTLLLIDFFLNFFSAFLFLLWVIPAFLCLQFPLFEYDSDIG